MPRRKAWNGEPPQNAEQARRFLVEVARDCVERLGLDKAGLSDVAEAAGVTRQTVYRYFRDADDLFHSAAALSSGGFHARMRAHVLRQTRLPERMVECLVFCVREVPSDPHLSALVKNGDYFKVTAALKLAFVQDEIAFLAGNKSTLSARDRDELAELMLRLLHSFLFDPGEARTETALRAFLRGLLVPVIEARMGRPSSRSR